MKREHAALRYGEWMAAVLMAFGLTACGGGGGYVRPTPNPAPSPVTPPPTTPPTAPSEPGAQPPVDVQLTVTGAAAAHAQGYTGAGVTIGFADSGIMRNHPALSGRVLAELTYVDPRSNNLAVDDVAGHGTLVAEIAAGRPVGKFAGGIAPDADLVSARILADDAPHDDGSRPPAQVGAASAVPFQQVGADLVAAGVKVMNNSWGGITWSAADVATTQAFAAAYKPFAIDAGGLVVFAAGNASQPNPSTIAALPSLAPELAPGWLTVVAVDSNQPGQLASYSNQCGQAMHDCLAAPGDVVVSGATDTADNLTYWVVGGTSFSAPQVAGAAALVWQAYPYFTNDLVRQTLLGTADDLGAPGVDPVFGYGELDVARAVNGPMRFDWGDVTVDFTGTSRWNNPISGAGGLVKQGPGTLVLTAPASYAGATRIAGGVLVAQALAGDVDVGAGATLEATPSVGGGVTNAGTVAVHGADTTVGGSYVQQAGGRLAVSLGAALRVTGTATLAGGDLYVLGTEPGYVTDSHTEVLSATGGLSGTFDAVDKAANVTLLAATAQYDAHTAWLDVTQVAATAVPDMTYTAASQAAAARVDAAFSAINDQLAAPAASAASGTPLAAGFVAGAAQLQRTAGTDALQRSLESLSGQLRAAGAALAFASIDAGARAFSAHVDQWLDGQPSGAWTQNLGRTGDLAPAGYGAMGYDVSGWMLGTDRPLGANGVAGYAFSRGTGVARLAGAPDQTRRVGREGMAWIGAMRGPWYVTGRVAAGDYRGSMLRQVVLGNAAANVQGEDRGRYGLAQVELGYRVDAGPARLLPYVGVQYAALGRDGFIERGADGFGLKAGDQLTTRSLADVGLRAARSFLPAAGGVLQLEGHVAWQRSFGLRGAALDASFAGANQWAPLGGVGLARHGALAGATLDWSMGTRGRLAVGYDRYFGQYGAATLTTLDYRWSF